MEKQIFKLSSLGVTEDELLEQVRRERKEGEDFSYSFKQEIEFDLKLLKNKRDKKKDEKLVGDTTLFNTHTALLARSYQSKNQIKIRGDKNGAEREVKMLNAVLTEDNESAVMKALKYYLYYDKFATGVAIIGRNGWDGVYKRNTFQVINPLTWIMDPSGDYFAGNYRYTGFFAMRTRHELKEMGVDADDLITSYEKGAKELKERMQRVSGLAPDADYGRELFDVYYHWTRVNGTWVYTITANLDSYLIEAWVVEASSPLEAKKKEAIMPPFAFFYWKPDRDNPFGERPANLIRDVQLTKARIKNLRLNKMEAELYPMYLYNKDYVSGKDLTFGFNKGIPISTGIDGAAVNLQNIVSPIQKDLKVDTSFAVEQDLDNMVERSTSIGAIVQGTTTQRRETLGTNQLVATNTDVNLSLNEEVHAVGDEQFIKLWFGGYYINFADGDKKLVYAGSSTGEQAIVLRRSDFIYEGNLSFSIESNIGNEDRKRKEMAATVQITPILLPTLAPASKIKYMRWMSERAWIPVENVEEFLPKTPQMIMQSLENELLKQNTYVPINENDAHEEHLIEMGSVMQTEEMELHQLAHIQAMIALGQQPAANMSDKSTENAMSVSMGAQAMGQAWAELAA